MGVIVCWALCLGACSVGFRMGFSFDKDLLINCFGYKWELVVLGYEVLGFFFGFGVCRSFCSSC